ncbi:hypothetical protein ACYBSK_16635 [Streptomyces sp. BYX5S]
MDGEERQRHPGNVGEVPHVPPLGAAAPPHREQQRPAAEEEERDQRHQALGEGPEEGEERGGRYDEGDQDEHEGGGVAAVPDPADQRFDDELAHGPRQDPRERGDRQSEEGTEEPAERHRAEPPQHGARAVPFLP